MARRTVTVGAAPAAKRVPAAALTRHLNAGRRKAEKLEPKLAAVLKRIFDQQADQVADAFARKATHHLTAHAGVTGRSHRQVVAHTLTGPGALTAASDQQQQDPGWSPPAPDEIINVETLAATLRTKTDPVRLAVIQDSMEPALAEAGLAFDVTNPLTARVLAQSGSQVTNIAQTTRLNVMRSISASYNQGLSIPDTAKLIRSGMKDASEARATLIARTELVGAVSGGSLAATQIVEDATGVQYIKTWITSPGAKFPRHEEYDGLDGQTRQLDEPFDVGESQLQFPGDPDGDVSEVANCRCTLVYDEAAAQEAESLGLDTSDASS